MGCLNTSPSAPCRGRRGTGDGRLETEFELTLVGSSVDRKKCTGDTAVESAGPM